MDLQISDLTDLTDLTGMENEMLADYLQRDAERTSGLEDTDEVGRPINPIAPRILDQFI